MNNRFRRWLGLQARQPDVPEYRRVTPHELHGAIDEADRLVVRSSPEPDGVLLFESRDRRDLDQLKDTLAVVELPIDQEWGERCPCDGGEAILLYRQGEDTVLLTNHHGTSVQCNLWAFDARIVDRKRWLDWLAVRRPACPPMDVLTAGDSFAAIQSLQSRSDAGTVCHFALRMSLADGRKVRLDPCEVAIPGERFPALGLSLEEVEDFPVIRRWPNGPIHEAETIEVLVPCLGKRISKAFYSDSIGEGAISCIEFRFDDGSAFSVYHDAPMTLEMKCSSSDTRTTPGNTPGYRSP